VSKARKRHRQPWWKRNKYNRQRAKYYRRHPVPLVSFDTMMRALYPKEVGVVP
jgi:hypothetical protein